MSCLLGLIRRLVWQPVGGFVEFSLDLQCGRASCELSEETKNRWHIIFANHVGVDFVNHESENLLALAKKNFGGQHWGGRLGRATDFESESPLT